ncbi:MAG: hypothetical protein ACR2PX_15525 [Endozoicomonas sp.]|uniref:hypothetical protein n=1 Tax=Endozoicomonas sp. TaxID=1892382 RepID=UPI003D9B8457
MSKPVIFLKAAVIILTLTRSVVGSDSLLTVHTQQHTFSFSNNQTQLFYGNSIDLTDPIPFSSNDLLEVCLISQYQTTCSLLPLSLKTELRRFISGMWDITALSNFSEHYPHYLYEIPDCKFLLAKLFRLTRLFFDIRYIYCNGDCFWYSPFSPLAL